MSSTRQNMRAGAALALTLLIGSGVRVGAAAAGADINGLWTDQLGVCVSPNGCFSAGTLPVGSAILPGATSVALLAGWPDVTGASFATVRIDGVDRTLGSDVQPVLAPYNNGSVSTTVYQVDDITITQQLNIVPGACTGRQDTLQVRYIIANAKGTSAHQVGLRLLLDTVIGQADPPVAVLDQSDTIVTGEAIYPRQLQVPSLCAVVGYDGLGSAPLGVLSGFGNVRPDRFAVVNWNLASQTAFDYTPSSAGLVDNRALAYWWQPSVLAPGSQRTVATSYGPGGFTSAQQTTAVQAAVTAPVALSAGNDRTFPVMVVAAGRTMVGNTTVSLSLPAGLKIVAPPVQSTVRAFNGDASWVLQGLDIAPARTGGWLVDASGFAGGQADLVVTLTPPVGPVLTLHRYITIAGTGPVAADPVASQISADAPGDVLGSQTPIKLTVQVVGIDGRRQLGIPASDVRFEVQPTTGLTYTRSTEPSDSSGQVYAYVTSSVAQTVGIRASVRGVALKEWVVLEFGNPNTAGSLALAGRQLVSLPSCRLTTDWLGLQSQFKGTPVFTRFDAANRKYATFSAADLLSAGLGAVGRGFWVKSSEPWELHTEGVPAVILPYPSNVPTPSLQLDGEWNLLGNPGLGDMQWALSAFSLEVNGADVGTLDKPANWQYVDPYAWIWDAANSRYQLVFDNSMLGFETVRNSVPKYAGFWLRRRPSTDVIRLHTDYNKLFATTPTARRQGGGWAVTLESRAAGWPSGQAVIGANPQLGADLEVAAAPPAGDAGLALSVVSGTRALAGQIRSAAASSSYELDSAAPAGLDVTLAWPRLARELPSGRGAVLVDLSTGRRVAMGSTSGFTYRSDGQSRRFRVELVAAGSGRVNVGLSLTPAGRAKGAGISVTLDQAATVRLEIRSQSGRLVRTLSTDLLPAGVSTVAWNGLDDQGRPLPGGLYQVLVSAVDANGGVARGSANLRL